MTMIQPGPRTPRSVDECITDAYKLLGDVTDALRFGDDPAHQPTKKQRTQLRRVALAVSKAKEALNNARNV